MSRLRLSFFIPCMLFIGIFADRAVADGQGSMPRIVCADSDFDFGRIVDTNRIGHTFHIRNDGESPLLISRVWTGCGCVEATVKTDTIMPHSSADLDVVFDTVGRIGPQRKSIYVHSNDSQTPVLNLAMRGELVVRRGGEDKAAVISRPESGQDHSQQGDYYATPAEITYVLSPGRSNPVTRYIAVRSLTGKPFRVNKVDLPFPGTVESQAQDDPARQLICIKDVIPFMAMSDKSIRIHVADDRTVIVPVTVKGRLP